MAICDQFSNPRNSVIFCPNEVILGSNDVPRSEFLKYGQKSGKSHMGLLRPPEGVLASAANNYPCDIFFSVPKLFYEFLVHSRTFDKILEVYEHTPRNGIKFRVF